MNDKCADCGEENEQLITFKKTKFCVSCIADRGSQGFLDMADEIIQEETALPLELE